MGQVCVKCVSRLSSVCQNIKCVSSVSRLFQVCLVCVKFVEV